jgi:hypothetical protein
MADEIIKELWQIKDRMANEYGCDVKALIDYLRTKKHSADVNVINLRAMKAEAERANLHNGL